MVKYLKDGESFSFSRDFGFHGSAETPRHGEPMHKAHGGTVQHKAMGGPAQMPQQPVQEPTISMPVSTAQRMAKGIALAGAQQGAAALARTARAGGRPGLAGPTVGGPLSGAPQRPNVAPMAAPGAPGTPVPMKKGGHFIQKAVKHPGRMTELAKRHGISTHEEMVRDSHSKDPSLRSAANLGLRMTGGDLSPHKRKK
jgi:hypothetical protein